MRESEIEKKANLYGKKRGWRCDKFKTTNRRSVPDRICFRNGVTIFIEYKATSKEPTELQNREMKRLKDLGFRVYWTDSVKGAKAIFDAQDL